jgi:hypothetical protein
MGPSFLEVSNNINNLHKMFSTQSAVCANKCDLASAPKVIVLPVSAMAM